MPEEGKDMAEIEHGQKGGEPVIEIDSKDNPYEAQRQRQREIQEAGKAPQPINTSPSVPRPWNDEMLRPDSKGRYRIVDLKGNVHPLPRRKSR